jgi:Cdc6-like AAA superfamily ATPase
LNTEENRRLDLRVGQVFSPAAPIDKTALFAGRVRQLRQVVDAVNQRGQHAIIYGERGVGKTSLANVLAENLEAPGGRIICPHINCDSEDNYSKLWRKVFLAIEIIDQRQRAGFQRSLFEQTTSLADNLPDQIFSGEVRRVLGVLSQEALLVVIVDEFDRLKAPGKTMMADTVKMLSDQAIPATLVLVGVADSVNQLISEHQSVERALVQVPMPRMSADELKEIIDKGLGQLDMKIQLAARDRIAGLSRGLPHYTHLLAKHAARRAISQGGLMVSEDHVGAAIQVALTEAQQTIRSSYHHATSSTQKGNLYAQVLLAAAIAPTDEMGYFAPADVREPMTRIMGKPYDIPNFQRHLTDFCSTTRGEILQKTGAPHRWRYRFANPLMQPFVVLQGYAGGLLAEDGESGV